MQTIIRTSFVLWVASGVKTQENFIKTTVTSHCAREDSLTTSEENVAAERIRDQKLKIAAMVDGQNVKFSLQLEAASERRHREFRKWTRAELLRRMNSRTSEVLGMESLRNSLDELLALGAGEEEAVAAVAEHMDEEHMETTVMHALDADYPMGMLPFWEIDVARSAAEEAVRLIRKSVQELVAAKNLPSAA